MEDPFATAAAHYAAHRPPYDERAIAHVRDRFALDGTGRALDLGCGTGEIAVPLAAHVDRVVAIDPSRPMLRQARRRAREADGVSVVQGSDASLPALRPGFAVATVGRALHRTDRDRTLDRLRELSDGVAVVGDTEWLTRGTRPWEAAVYEVVSDYVDAPERTGPVEYDEPYDAVLRDHGYRDVTVETVTSERTWTVDGVVGYLLSLSFCSPAVLGDRRAAFERECRERLASEGPLVHEVETRVTTGRA